MRISLIQMCQTCGYDTMIDAESSTEGVRWLCPLIPPTPFSHTGRRGSVDVLMPETGDGTQALDHAPACAGAAQQRLQSPLKGLRPRARRRGRSSFTAARTSDCNRPWRASDRAPAGAGEEAAIDIASEGPPAGRPPARAILLHRLTHQRWTSPLKGLRPVARRRGRSSFTASRTSD
jgi:hypothetical protein